MSQSGTPPSEVSRMFSLIQTGPRSLVLRFYDQIKRKLTGAPVYHLSEIVPNLYVGGQHYPKGWDKMQAEGITAVVNMRENHHDDTKKGIGGEAHLHLATRDNTPPTLEDLKRAAEFIAENIDQGKGVYVHCGVGVGRAPSAAAAYLIYQGMSAEEAYRTIKKKRPFVHLTYAQRMQLNHFEEFIHDHLPQTQE